MRNILAKYLIPQLFLTIKTQLSGTQQEIIQSKMPPQIGVIYGVSTTAGTVDDTNKTLITIAQSSQLYLTLLQGSSQVLANINLQKLVYTTGPVVTTPPSSKRYLEMNISGDISLDQSFYSNPTGITPAEIMLELWYLDTDMVNYLQQKGAIDISAPKPMPGASMITR